MQHAIIKAPSNSGRWLCQVTRSVCCLWFQTRRFPLVPYLTYPFCSTTSQGAFRRAEIKT